MKFTDIIDISKGYENCEPAWSVIETIPEFAALKKTKQNTEWHQEGDAFTHTRMVTEQMMKLMTPEVIKNHYPEYRLLMIAAALCHDLGKANTTKWDEAKQNWGCKRHGQESARIIRTLFFDEDFSLREQVCFIARNHMTLHHVFDKPERTDRAVLRLCHGFWVTLEEMRYMKIADSLGSINSLDTPEFVADFDKRICAVAEKYGNPTWENPYFKNDWHRVEYFANPDKYTLPDDVVVDDEQNKTLSPMIVYMMVGVPGSGKDWWIENKLPNASAFKILSRDLIRTEIGLTGEKPQGNKQQEQEVTRIFDERMQEYFKTRQSFVINNTNLRGMYRQKFVSECLKHHALIYYVYCEAPSLDMNKKRREGMMPTSVIDRMWRDFEFPDASEYFDIVFNVQREINKVDE